MENVMTEIIVTEARASDNAAVALPAKRKKRRGGGGDPPFFDPLSDGGSIRTAATRDRNSPALSSPRIPKGPYTFDVPKMLPPLSSLGVKYSLIFGTDQAWRLILLSFCIQYIPATVSSDIVSNRV